MLTAQLDYELPPPLIATAPARPRDAARLMVADRSTGRVEHHRVCDLPNLICGNARQVAAPGPGDLLVFNDSRVLPARFLARRDATGGRVTGLYLESSSRQQGCYWVVLLESRGRLRAGERVHLDAHAQLELEDDLGNGQWLARLKSPDDTLTLLERIGQTPLPPYIQRARRRRQQAPVSPQDRDQYNTVFAYQPGSIAAPTAGLHFTRALLDELERVGVRRATVTLHVGLGTFAPVRTDRLEDHPIHREWVTVPKTTIAALLATRGSGGRIIPVGTTTVRALESLPHPVPKSGDFDAHTGLFITPDGTAGGTSSVGGLPGQDPFFFRFTDALMTNFHLPRSTLLALVAALPGVGLQRLMSWYGQAIERGYRFYSYGDAMLIL